MCVCMFACILRVVCVCVVCVVCMCDICVVCGRCVWRMCGVCVCSWCVCSWCVCSWYVYSWCVCVVYVCVWYMCVCAQCPGVLGKGKSWPWILGLQRAPRTSLVTHFFFFKNKSLIITHNIIQNVPFHPHFQHNSPPPCCRPGFTCRVWGLCSQFCLSNLSCLRAA